MNNHKTCILYFISMLLIVLFIGCDQTPPVNEYEYENQNMLIIYPNSGNQFSIIDLNTEEFVETRTFEIPDSLILWGICQSSYKDHLIFVGFDSETHDWFVVNYELELDSTINVFPMGIDIAAPHMCPSYLSYDPSTIYLYTHQSNLRSIDFENENIKFISLASIFGGDLHVSDSREWIVLINHYQTTKKSYDELSFYKTENALEKKEFNLNRNDADSMNVLNIQFSTNDDFLFVTYIPSNYFDCEGQRFRKYDLSTRESSDTIIELPWTCGGGYQIGYNGNLDECYVVGCSDSIFVVDVSSQNPTIKDKIKITGKMFDSPSEIIVREDVNKAYITSRNDEKLFVIDLLTGEVTNTIDLGLRPVKVLFY